MNEWMNVSKASEQIYGVSSDDKYLLEVVCVCVGLYNDEYNTWPGFRWLYANVCSFFFFFFWFIPFIIIFGAIWTIISDYLRARSAKSSWLKSQLKIRYKVNVMEHNFLSLYTAMSCFFFASFIHLNHLNWLWTLNRDRNRNWSDIVMRISVIRCDNW